MEIFFLGILKVFTAFQIKHFICDFPLQGPFQYKNKGTYGHPGGLLHSIIHALGTLPICLLFNFPLYLVLLDAVIHYHIDWAKMNINKHYNLLPNNSEYFWWLLGLDQFLHQLTYILIIALGVSG